LRWPFRGPGLAPGGEVERLDAFRRARDAIDRRIRSGSRRSDRGRDLGTAALREQPSRPLVLDCILLLAFSAGSQRPVPKVRVTAASSALEPSRTKGVGRPASRPRPTKSSSNASLTAASPSLPAAGRGCAFAPPSVMPGATTIVLAAAVLDAVDS